MLLLKIDEFSNKLRLWYRLNFFVVTAHLRTFPLGPPCWLLALNWGFEVLVSASEPTTSSTSSWNAMDLMMIWPRQPHLVAYGFLSLTLQPRLDIMVGGSHYQRPSRNRNRVAIP